MSGGDDLKSHALNSSNDFYELLGIASTANESEIRRAYRKTALKYHPDKVGASDTAALDKFHLLQIAYDVLSDAGVRELYDNARRAREEKKHREAAYEGRRKWLKEDLERRESGALKRKREEADEEEAFERELRRIAEDGKRRRKEREEKLRQEALEVEEGEQQREDGDVDAQATPQRNGGGGLAEIDRSVTLRFPKTSNAVHMEKEDLVALFQRFGPIDEAILRDKKMKLDGEKHRKLYTTAILVFESVVGAHAAVLDIAKLRSEDPETWGMFEQVGWASGKEPDYIPKPATPVNKPRSAESLLARDRALPTTPLKDAGNMDGAGLRKVPSFGSFKGTPKGTPRGPNSPSLDEITMIRLKNAERRRMEEKIRKKEAEAAPVAAGE